MTPKLHDFLEPTGFAGSDFSYNNLRSYKWRRRESNPIDYIYNQLNGHDLQIEEEEGAASEQRSPISNRHFNSLIDTVIDSIPPSVSRIADAWPLLPPHIREAILTLVDAAVQINGSQVSRQTLDYEGKDKEWDRFRGFARVLAIRCRAVVQDCLWEEEWHDADEAFCEVITEGLAGL